MFNRPGWMLPVLVGAALALTPDFRTGPVATTCHRRDAVPLDYVLHLAYALDSDAEGLEGDQLARLVQSAWSAFAVGCGGDDVRGTACRERLLVHVFYQGIRDEVLHRVLAPLVLRGLRMALHATDFESEVTRQRTVWGYDKHSDHSLQQKLMKAANYYRFYMPKFLRDAYGAGSFLYLDSDTIFLASGLEELLNARPLPLAMAGEQKIKSCTVGKMLLLDDMRLRSLGLEPHGTCLAPSVMVYNTSLWLATNMTTTVERLLAQNAAAKLWHLGSMPPLMVALHGRWTAFPSSIVSDGKGSDCSWLQRSGWPGGRLPTLVHPFKSLCASAAATPLAATVCMQRGSKNSLIGSYRIASMQAAALADLLGGTLKKNRSRGCDVFVDYGALQAPEDISRGGLHVLFKADNRELAPAPATASSDGNARVLVVADNGYIADIWETKKQPAVRLLLVEDVRPAGIRHEPWPGMFETRETLRENMAAVRVTRRPLLCYHGNMMHIMSLLPRLGRLRAAFTLRVIEHAAAGGLKVVEAALGNFSMLSGVEIEKIPYNVNRIHAQLQGCDVGLAPSEVASTVSYAKLSQETATWFVSDDVQAEDTVRRCKRTENAGRAFVFFQLGVPTVLDACTESVLFSSADEKPLALVAYHADAWVPHISRLLASPQLRRDLSRNSRAFASVHLTTRAQAVKLLDSLSCVALWRPGPAPGVGNRQMQKGEESRAHHRHAHSHTHST